MSNSRQGQKPGRAGRNAGFNNKKDRPWGPVQNGTVMARSIAPRRRTAAKDVRDQINGVREVDGAVAISISDT